MANCSQCQTELDSDFGIQICSQCGYQNVFDVVGGMSTPQVTVPEVEANPFDPSPPMPAAYEVNESVHAYSYMTDENESLNVVTESPSSAAEVEPVVYYEIGESTDSPAAAPAAEPTDFLSDMQSYADRSDGPTFKLEYDVLITQLDFKSQIHQLKDIFDELSLDEQQISWNPEKGQLKVQHLSMPRTSLLIKKLGVLNVDYRIMASS